MVIRGLSLAQDSGLKTEVSLLKIIFESVKVNFSEAHHRLCPETSLAVCFG